MAEETKQANPAALGLVGFGLTTVMLSLINAGVLPHCGEQAVLPLAFAFGGFIQILAGLFEFKAGLLGMKSLSVAGGWVGLICGLLAMYTSFALVTNITFNRTVLPLGLPFVD